MRKAAEADGRPVVLSRMDIYNPCMQIFKGFMLLL